jgi:3-methyladenine DNA glycosylase AlkD
MLATEIVLGRGGGHGRLWGCQDPEVLERWMSAVPATIPMMDEIRLRAADQDLDRRLSAAADPRVRDHWTAYLKGTAEFRGVPMAGVRSALRGTWNGLDLAAWEIDDLLELAGRWFACPATEDKLAAVLMIAEQIMTRLELRHAMVLAAPLEAGHLTDWNVVDWYAVKALAGFVSAGTDAEARTRLIASWAGAPGLWQRRAAAVTLVPLAPRGESVFAGFTELCLEVCRGNVEASAERWAHTGPGWLLRELSIADPEAVRRFVDTTPSFSPEGRRMATARLRGGVYRRR